MYTVTYSDFNRHLKLNSSLFKAKYKIFPNWILSHSFLFWFLKFLKTESYESVLLLFILLPTSNSSSGQFDYL